ncbi:flagellar biosynthetic protein FliO [Sphingomonas sp. DC1600-2]|uniref:flagellar biosynthetic protein FliO n=1 Tax=unclassified Sphingomonas TaxID=196159 RepID=UPI003CF66008
MDVLSLLRTMGALGVVLGLLGGALWVVRRYNIALPGRVTLGRGRRLEVVERVTLDGKRSLALVRRDGCEHLILIGPDGQMVVESGILPSVPADVAATVVAATADVAESAETLTSELAAPEPVAPAPEPALGSTAEATVDQATAPEPETELRTALTLLLDHLQSRRDKAALIQASLSSAREPSAPVSPVTSVSSTPRRSVAALFDHLTEQHHQANVVA